jgi:Ca2+-binding EF-hand superfamily protein
MSFPFALNRVLVGSVIAGFAFAASAQTADTSKAPSADASTKAGAAVDSAFSKADTNHDGKLSKEEAAKVPAIAAKFDQLDKDKKGYLTAEDFSAASK